VRTCTLGRTGIEVSQLGLGGLFISKVGGAFDQARSAIHRAVELGINYIDTAPGYLDSEEVLGRALEDVSAPLVVSTKLGGRPDPFDPQDRDGLLWSVEESLRLLRRDTIDILLIHEPDRQREYNWWTDLDRFHGPVVEVLDELKRSGTIRFTGLGGTTAYEMARVMDTGQYDMVLTAFNYSLLWREAEHEVIPTARKHHMGVVIGSPLQQGALARRYDAEIADGAPWMSLPRRLQYKALYALVAEIGMPLTELAHRFVISNPDVSCVLSGSRSVAEVEANIRTVEQGPLPVDILERLDEVAAMVPFRPYEEPFGLPFGSDRPNTPGRGGR